MTFVLIPAGTFTMGSDMLHNEKPVHPVRLSKPFWLSRHEVTQEQWQVVMGGNPSRFADNPKRPVERVSWEDVQEFLQRLNIREGWARYRLPTEAEWEYAARADTTTPYSFTGPLLTLLSKHAWYRDSAAKQTHPVGQLQPNPWGLYDMHGNVWEWVQDWYQDWYAPTTAEPVIDPTGPPSGSTRVIRGGSWYDSPVACRSTYRNGEVPGYRYDGLGFRLARDVSNPAP
jgi:formylglycine-generating enzyme required for sulfatase activity